ncbi:alpha-mannosidase 2-like [Maniola jurtina]|uniref:alpha-mannosidase 2-like n=1 Tax=Maniola jurtina TaxID=191418 RepID=UPI001E68AADB|nr:alpha-mannosidase 2-like [Maniola jurtina]
MNVRVKGKFWSITFFIIFITIFENECYEKTLRKIVRNQSKMVQRPFSESGNDFKNLKLNNKVIYPGYAQKKSTVHKMQRLKMPTILTNEIVHPFDLRTARNAINLFRRREESSILPGAISNEFLNTSNVAIPTSIFFPPAEEKVPSSSEQDSSMKYNVVTSDKSAINDKLLAKSVISSTETTNDGEFEANAIELNLTYYDTGVKKADFFSNKGSAKVTISNNKSWHIPFSCTEFHEFKADIDAQEKFNEFNIEPSWIGNKHFWNLVYEGRYEALMRDAQWPALKVILVPRSHVDTIWKQPFENLHKNAARKIISNIVKKLQFYSNLTFSWNEVSHLSQWWQNARQKSRTALRRLVEEGRLEITTGGWVQTDEATSHLFGILHQLIEGHQWLLYNLNYSPVVAWLTNSVTHSPTLPYILSASGISNLVLTNMHFSWQQYLTEYQYTDFVWVQNWDTDKTAHTNLNEALNRIGNDRYPKHSVITHYLPFNSDGFKACGPEGEPICDMEFNFIDSSTQDLNTFNLKVKAEKLLEQYSKAGTISSHNVIISPLGGDHHYESQTEFDFQYNNYQKIADYVNLNHDIYKATIKFGTSKDYFKNILSKQNSFPSLKGDFLNFADIRDGRPAYWTGYFSTRSLLKIILRRLHSTLRSTEILFSFALNFNAFNSYKVSTLYERLLNARESVARLQDRNVVSGTLTVNALRYVQQQVIKTSRDCWSIQETAASLISSKPAQNETYLEKYIYREGEFITSYKSVTPGDQIYIFNSLNHERIEIVELLTRHPNVRIIDHIENEVQIQINPVWKFGLEKRVRISSHFFKMTFIAKVPPLAFVLFKIERILHVTHNAATIYCTSCVVDRFDDASDFVFNVRPLETGDIQLESYRYRIVIDEHTGFLKTVTQKLSIEQPVVVDFGAFTSASVNSGMFLFNTNTSKPMEDILSPFRQSVESRAIIIVSGQITTELTSLYGNVLQHTVKIFNVMKNPLADIIKLETKINYDVAPNRDTEMFLSLQTVIGNGNPPEIFIDNNGFQYTARNINVSRSIESNVYPFTSMAYIQDQKTRLTILSDHAQAVTALQEGQLVLMLDRRVHYDDNQRPNEGTAENSMTTHTHYLLLENFIENKNSFDEVFSKTDLKLPSHTALYLADTLNYNLDIYFIDANRTHLCHYTYLPLIKTSFPCDVALINYRAVLNRGTPEKFKPNAALMTLHRQRFCCRIESDASMQCSRESSFKLDNVLRKIRAVYLTNLVGTTEGVPVTVLNKINFPSMELTTLRIYF